MVFGQVVIGPPGSGKTTYCVGMQQYLEALGRKVAVVNLDPANETVPDGAPAPLLSVSTLVSLRDAMAQHSLGPNGGLVHCIETLEANVEWLIEGATSSDHDFCAATTSHEQPPEHQIFLPDPATTSS